MSLDRRPDADERTGDEGMALMTAVLLIMIVGALSVLMLGVVVAQVQPTMFGAKNTRTIVAAEAGIDAALSQLRSATVIDTTTHQPVGDPKKLPCTVQGAVTGASAAYSYKVQVSYFDEDPREKNAAWRSANLLKCTTGLTLPPSYAVLSAEGLDAGVPGMATAAGNRTLESVYTFQLVNNNILGGAIYSYGVGFCLQADGQSIGSTISYVSAEQCRTDDPRRLWSWNQDYKIHLAVTDLAGSAPLCITGRPASGQTKIDATLQLCAAARTDQLFSWQGGAKWEGQNAGNTNYSGFCLGTDPAAGSNLLGKKLWVSNPCGNNNASGSFDPDPRVGAGNASYDTHQIVNFLEFGRCFDVTDQLTGSAQMIVYPCKQDPSPGSTKIPWNHEWFYTEPPLKTGTAAKQLIYVNVDKSTSKKFCLKTPAQTPETGYVTLSSTCGAGKDFEWYRDADTSDPATSWRIRDGYGRCASLGPKWGVWSTIVVTKCSGGPEQKWNAPPTTQSATLDNYRELTN